MALPARWKLGLLTWGAGMLGVVATTVLGVPRILAMLPERLGREVPMPLPYWALLLSSLVQSSLLVGLAAWSGVALGSSASPLAGVRTFQGRLRDRVPEGNV